MNRLILSVGSNSQAGDFDRPSVILAAILVSVAGVSIYMIQPLFLGAAAEQFDLAPRQIGFLAAAETGGVGLASLLGVFWIKRLNWRLLAYASTGVILLGNITSAGADTFAILPALRFITGFFGEGIAYALGVAALSETRNPDRVFAYATVAQAIYAMAGMFVLPIVIQGWGMDGVLYVISGFVFIAMTFIYLIPARGIKHRPDTSASAAIKSHTAGVVFLGLFIHLIWYVGVGAMWAFIERIAVNAGLELDQIGTGLAIALGFGVVGAAFAAWLGDRFGRVWPFTISLSLQIVAIIILAGGMSFLTFCIAFSLFWITWNLCLPYMLGLIASSDTGGKYAVLIPAFQALGVTMGAAIAGMLVTGDSYVGANLLAGACCMVTLVMFIPFALWVTRRSGGDAKFASAHASEG